MTTRTTRGRKPARPKKKGAGWAAFWRLLGQLAVIRQQARAATRTSRPTQRPKPAARGGGAKPKPSRGGSGAGGGPRRPGSGSGAQPGAAGGGARGGGGWQPLDGRPVDDPRQFTARDDRPAWQAGGYPDPTNRDWVDDSLTNDPLPDDGADDGGFDGAEGGGFDASSVAGGAV